MAESPKEYLLQETVEGQTVTYDATGRAIDKNFAPSRGGPVETLLFRKKGENEMRIRDVNTHSPNHVKIKAGEPGTPCNYIIDWTTVPNAWTRNGHCANSGGITDLEIREDVANDPWLEVQWMRDGVEILLKAGRSSCTYRFNKVLQRWERIC